MIIRKNPLRVIINITVISGAAGFIVMFLNWLIGTRKNNLAKYLDIFDFAFLSVFLILLSGWIINIIRMSGKKAKAQIIMQEKGYCSELFEILEKQADKGRNTYKGITSRLELCETYCDAEMFDKAGELLKTFDYKTYSDELLARYYCTVMYYFLSKGETDEAGLACESAKDVFDKCSDSKVFDKILLVKGILLFSSKEYYDAENILKEVIRISKNQKIIADAYMFLALSYLWTNRPALAKESVVSAAPLIVTKRQENDIRKLMKSVERMFGINGSE